MNKVQQSYGIRQLEAHLRPSGKSIIEEWQNAANRYDGILRNDEYYEERGVDVGDDPRSLSNSRSSFMREGTSGPKNFINQSGKTSSGTIVQNIDPNGFTKRADDEKNNKNHSTGTVRSIPIKDYRASMAHDMGTFGRSIMPQQQFETFKSEGGSRNLREPLDRRRRSSGGRKSSGKNRFSCVASIPLQRNVGTSFSCRMDEPRNRSKSRRSSRSKNERRRNETIEFLPSHRYFEDEEDFFFEPEVCKSRGSSRRRDRSIDEARNAVPRSHPQESDQNCRNAERVPHGDNRGYERKQSVDLERGNVVKKISVYEGNVRSSLRSERPSSRAIVQEGVVGHRHRTIGVPLVGMHNACGLPVVAAWPENHFIGTLRVPSRLVNKICHVAENGNLRTRSRTHPKRKAPQPGDQDDKRSNQEFRLEENSQLPVSEKITASTRSATRKRILKRPSFKADRVNSMPYKQRYSRRNALEKIGSKDVRTHGKSSSFGQRSIDKRSLKRSTLYAKDEGTEAAEVLTNLCLNPLARNKGASNMMW